MAFARAVDRAGFVCAAGAQPGAVELRAGVLEADATGQVYDLGIFNCRPPRGATAGARVRVSLHGEGRAWDAGIRPGGRAAGVELAQRLVAVADELGVQRVIWERKEWDALSRRWDPYTGVDPHTSHLHIELSWAAARGLTIDMVRLALGPEEDDMAAADVERLEGKIDRLADRLELVVGRVATSSSLDDVPLGKRSVVERRVSLLYLHMIRGGDDADMTSHLEELEGILRALPAATVEHLLARLES